MGHSNFAITADLYAHLDASSKVASAEKMTWINNTSLAQAVVDEKEAVSESTTGNGNAPQNLSDILCDLLAHGAPAETLQAWLKQEDFSKHEGLHERFYSFMRAESAIQQGA